MKKIIATLLFTALILSSFVSSLASSGLISNPSFEEYQGNKINNWQTSSYEDKGSISIDNKTVHSGKASIKIYNPEKTDSRVLQNVNVEPNSIYYFTCWVKTEKVAPGGIGANISSQDITSKSISITGDTQWTKLDFYGKTDINQRDVNLTLGLGGYGSTVTGTAWFDDIEATKIETAPAGVTVNNLFTAKDTSSENGSNSSNFIIFALVFLFIILLISGVAFLLLKYKADNKTSKTSPNMKTSNSNKLIAPPKEAELQEPVKLKLKLNDFIMMGIATLLYSIIAIVNLGSAFVPEKGWEATSPGDSFIIELSQPIETNKVGLYYGYGVGKYKIEYLNQTNNFVSLADVDKKEGQIFKWEYFNIPSLIKSNKFRFIVEKSGATLNEVAFFDINKNKIDITGAKVTNIESTNLQQEFSTLYDEQNKVATYNSYMNSTYFDEIYHARTAYENINELKVYEWTHPPLGKLIISVGIDLFGMNPFGWRIMGTIFGILMLPLMYLFALKLFRNRFYAFASMWLLAVDFMHFSQSRISTIDVFGTFFVLLMYYFIYDFYTYKSIGLGYKKSLISLLLCGMAFGVGSASKWICIYAGGGLALLFLITKIQEYQLWKKVTSKWKSARKGWVNDFIPVFIVKTTLWSVLFFVIIPIIIYSASYVPSYLDVQGEKTDKIWTNQEDMYNYHSKSVLGSTHPFSSRWYDWPTIRKPLLVYQGSDIANVKQGGIYRSFVKNPDQQAISSSIVIMGNPAIYWLGIIFFPLSIFLAWKRKHRGMAVVFIAFAFQFLPWMLVERLTFFYHFFSSVPFMIFSIVYVFKCLFENNEKTGYLALGGYLALCTILFFLFYPVLSGYEVPKTYVDIYLKWFKNNGNYKWFF